MDPDLPSWADLPVELLSMIGKRMETPFEVDRFRAVCPSWRASIPSRRVSFPLPSRLPFFYSFPCKFMFLLDYLRPVLKKLYYLEPLNNNPSPVSPKGWLMAIEELRGGGGRVKLLNPMTGDYFTALPPNFPRVLNLLEFKITEMHQMLVLKHIEPKKSEDSQLYVERGTYHAAIMENSSTSDGVVIIANYHGKLFAYRESADNWISLGEGCKSNLVNYKGQICANGDDGRTIQIDSCLNVSEIAWQIPHPMIFYGHQKDLVSSEGELLLIDKHKHGFAADGITGFGRYMDNIPGANMAAQFKIFKLCEEERRWVEVNSVGDRILFVTSECSGRSFWLCCVSGKEVEGYKKNCIFFKDLRHDHIEDEYEALKNGSYKYVPDEDGYLVPEFYRPSVGVFALEEGILGPLRCFPEYAALVWPPPAWLLENNNASSS